MRRRPLVVTTLATVTIAAIWIVDRETAPDDFRFSFVYMLPLAAAAWWGTRPGAFLCATVAACAVVSNDLALRPGATLLANAWNEFTRGVTLFALAMLISGIRASSERLRSDSERAFQLATTDPLTGLYNRRYLDNGLARAHAIAGRTHRPYVLLALELDNFKRINDYFGHLAGDAALRTFGEDLRGVIRAEDIAVRVDGDDFLVVLAEGSTQDAIALAQRLRQRLRAHTDLRHATSVSGGAVEWRPHAKIVELLGEADRLVAESKRAGGDRVSVAGAVHGD